jgi:two-component system response regulator HydG
MTQKQVMVVEDNQDIREVLKLQLEPGGYQVLEAANGEEAIGILQNEDDIITVDAILCDLRMPKMNGIEFINHLRQEAPQIPVAVVTGYPDMEMRDDLIKKGVKEYLVKPVTKNKLLALVSKLVSMRQEINFCPFPMASYCPFPMAS